MLVNHEVKKQTRTNRHINNVSIRMKASTEQWTTSQNTEIKA